MGDSKYKYHTINMPKALSDKIKEAIDSGKHGYTRVPEFVNAAVRKELRALGYIK